jgi:hypothetical protein
MGLAEYEATNRELGIDMSAGTGDWPDGLVVHTAGTAEDGAFYVAEVWASRDAQGAFMETRLGAALAAGGVTSPPKVTWVPLTTFHTPGI